MTCDTEHLRLLRAEESVELARTLAYRREAERCAGVAWSGLGPDPIRRRTAEALERDIAARLADLQRWRLSRSGRLLAAMAQAERAVEAVRTCLTGAPAPDDRRCRRAIGDLQRATTAARLVMDAAPAGGLSEGPCATSTASSNPSTA